MPVKKRKTAGRLRKKANSQTKAAKKTLKASVRKTASRKTPVAKTRRKVAVQAKKPMAVSEPAVEVLEVVETEIYEEPIVLTEDVELG